MEGGSEAVAAAPPAGSMSGWGRATVWSVDALDRFVCWMTYARLFDRFDLLGAWIDSEDQFSVTLWDRPGTRRGAVGFTVTADDWPDPRSSSPEGGGRELLSRLGRSPRGIGRTIAWDVRSATRNEPWRRLPSPGDPLQHGFHPDALGLSLPCAPPTGSRLSSATDLQYLYHGDMWASTMLWRMIDSVRGRWSACLRLLAAWVTAPDEFLIIFQDATPEQRGHAHGRRLRVGARIRSNAKVANPWDPVYLRPALEQLAELTATAPVSRRTRAGAAPFTICDDGICWIWHRATDPPPDTPWGGLYRRLLDRPVAGFERSS